MLRQICLDLLLLVNTGSSVFVSGEDDYEEFNVSKTASKEPRSCTNNNGQRRIRWGEGDCDYQLIQLARDGEDPRLPGRRKIFSWQDLLGMDRTLIYGERSGGGRDFLKWLRDSLGSSEPWIFAQGDRWARDLFQVSKPDNANLDKLKSDEKSFLVSLLEDDSATAAGKIVRWAEELEKNNQERKKGGFKRINLLIRDLARLPNRPEHNSQESAGQRAALALSKAAEYEVVSERIRLVLVDSSEDNFKDTYDASGLARLCWRFRLPWFGLQEVIRLAEHERYGLALTDATILDEFMLVTGGQPLLVHSLLRELKEEGGTLDVAAVQRGYRRLRDHPPSSVEKWKEDLAKGEPAVLEALAGFSGGSRRSKGQGLLTPHVSLFHSGWIRFDENTEHWKISSQLHGDYAQSALGVVRP